MKKTGMAIASIIIVIAVILGIVSFRKNVDSSSEQSGAAVQTSKIKHRKLNNKVVPTFFFHGAGSSYHAEQHMANAAVKAGAADQIIRADISTSNQVTLYGHFTKKAKHPIVEVNFGNNMAVNAGDVKNVLVAVQNKYGYHHVNLVGHSMGNLLIANYLNDYYNNKKLPQVQKVVSIAGHYNGWLHEGSFASSRLRANRKPIHMAPDFKQLLGLRKHYPRQIRVLNIYGNLMDGSHSDGAVSIYSALSYKYLINGRAKSYHEVEIKGKDAQHSHLHHNPQVDRLLIKFLWNK